MGSPNKADDMALREGSKPADGISRPPKSAGFEEKHISTAYPSPTQSDGASLRVCPPLLVANHVMLITACSGCSVLPSSWDSL
jgi:hypothetical protein